MPKKTRRYALTIYLLRLPGQKPAPRGSSWHHDVFKDPDDTKRGAHDVPELPGATLYTKQHQAKQPKWTTYFPSSAGKIKNSSSGGVLLLAVDKMPFAVCFGHGRHMLKAESIVEAFGLKATLNLIPPDKVRSIDKVTFDQLVRHSRVQATQQGSATAFGINIDQDIVRAVTGVPRDAYFGPRVDGRDAFKLSVEMAGIKELPGVLRRAASAYADTKYKESFPWIDHVREVSNSATIKELEQRLEQAIADKDYSRLWLSAPEIVEWDRIDGFKYGKGDNDTVSELSVDGLVQSMRRRDSKRPISSSALKNKRIYAVDSSGEYPYSPWSAHKCIYFEVEHKGEHYLLSVSRWFKIEKSYIDYVNKEISKIKPSSLTLVPSKKQKKGKENEATYNRRAVRKLGSKAMLADKENISFGGGHSKVEFCDIITTSPNRLVFVKHYGQSSVLSHLFSQALVSARLFKIDEGFREKLRDKIKIPRGFLARGATPNPRDYEVVLAIIDSRGGALTLPFFSRITLMLAYRDLTALDYKVSLLKIPVD